MRVLVTGANGFLGRGIVESILNSGHQVVATDFTLDGVDKRAEKYECDIFEIKDPYNYFERPDVVLHLAWRNGFAHYSDTHIEDLPKHYFFLSKLIDSELSRVAVMGSMHEIGFYEGSIKENTPCNPSTPYGISKNALRMLIQEKCSREKKKFQWLRGFYIVGNSSLGSSVFSKIAAAVNEGKRTFPFTTGQNQYDFLDYNDFCLQVSKTVEQDTVLGIINICSGKPEKLADRVERFIKDNGFAIRLEYGAFPDRPYDSKAVWGDSEKIHRIMAIK